MDLLSIIRLLKRKIWILLLFPVLSIVSTIILVSKMDKVYKSTAQIATGLTTDDAIKLSEGGTNPFEINTNFTNIMESMNSVPVLSLVSYRLVIHDLEDPLPFREFQPDGKSIDIKIDSETIKKVTPLFKERYDKLLPLNSIDADDRIMFAILKAYEYDYESLRKKLRIQRLSASDFISVDFLSENPVLSALAVNAICEEFIRYNKALKVDRSSESIEFLEALVKEKKNILDQKTAILNDYKVSNSVFNYSAESQSKISMIADYEQSKESEEKKINSLILSLSTVESKILTYDKSSQQEVLQVNQRIIDLRKQINELTNADSEINRTKINQLRDELQFEMGRLETINKGNTAEELKQLEKERDQLKLELKIAQSNLTSISQSLYKLKYEVSGFASKEAKLADLERDVLFASEDYVNVQDKYNTAKNKALVIGSTIRQILKGQPSYEPEPSKALLLILLAGVGSLVFCITVILAVEYMDFRIRIAPRLEQFTGLKNIGTLSRYNVQDFNLKRIFTERAADKQTQLFIHFLRKLRYEIEISKCKIFLITSTQIGVGKSFLIVCLSYTLSLINKRVLIIDTNFRNNSLTTMLLPKQEQVKLIKRGIFDAHDQSNSTDLSVNLKFSDSEYDSPSNKDVNDNQEDVKRKSIIYKTGYNGIDIIGNIGGLDSPSEILANRDFKNVISNLTSQYDYILMEGPSLNEYSDTKELIEYADRVVTVFAAESTITQLDRESVQFLKSIKGKLLGTILNKVELKDLAA